MNVELLAFAGSGLVTEIIQWAIVVVALALAGLAFYAASKVKERRMW